MSIEKKKEVSRFHGDGSTFPVFLDVHRESQDSDRFANKEIIKDKE